MARCTDNEDDDDDGDVEDDEYARGCAIPGNQLDGV